MTTVVVRLQGGLGNQMFQYAAGRAAAIRRNAHLYLDLHGLLDRQPRAGFTFREYELSAFRIDQRFASHAGLEWSCYPMAQRVLHKLKLRPPTGPRRSKENLPGPLQMEVVEGRGDLLLDGLWQSPWYFDDLQSAIRSDLTLWNPPAGPALRLREELSRTDAVCVHVRRTDFVQDPIMGGIGLAYYEQALAHLRERHGSLAIYVFSDDLPWCRDNFDFVGKPRFISMEDVDGSIYWYQDLMRHCRHFIIPNSTFSWWAAYLCKREDKSVIAPKDWYRGGDLAVHSVNVCPQSWVLI